MSGTKRHPIHRPSRHRPFTNEVVELFVELERTPQHSQRFEDGSRQLARMLGLTDEWWRGQHVNDRSSGPVHPEGYVAHGDWHRCRAIREALLAAVETLAAE